MLRADPSLRRGGAAERGGDTLLAAFGKSPVSGGVTVHANCAVTGALVLSRKILEPSLACGSSRDVKERRQAATYGRPCARSSP